MRRIILFILLLFSVDARATAHSTDYIEYHKHIIVAEQQFLYYNTPKFILLFKHAIYYSLICSISVMMKNKRQKVAGSLKNMMPTSTVPTAPIPVHTA